MLTALAGAGDQVGSDKLGEGDLDRGRPNGPALVGERGGELVAGRRAGGPERLEHAGGGRP